MLVEMELEKDIGRLEGRMEAVESQMKGINAKLDTVIVALRVTGGIGSAIIKLSPALISFGIGWACDHLFKVFP